MKKLICLLLAALSASAATITGPVGDISGNLYSPRIEFWPLSTPFSSGTTNIVGPKKEKQVVNGNFSIDLLPGRYLVKFPPTTNYFTIVVPTNGSSYALSEVATNLPAMAGIAQTAWILESSGVGTNPTFYGTITMPASGVSGYVWTATNSAGAGFWKAGGGSGSATNVFFIDSSTVTHTTVGGSNQFAVVGSALTGIPQSGVSGLPAALAALQSTNDLVRVWNVRDYGANGASVAADSTGFALGMSNLFRFGGKLYVPRGTYTVTNVFLGPSQSTNDPAGSYSDMEIAGDGLGASIVNVAITNAIWMTVPANPPVFRDLSFIHAGSGSTMIISNGFAGYPGLWERVGAYGFTNVCSIGASMGFKMLACEFEDNFFGPRFPRYTDGLFLDVRASRNVGAVVLGGLMPEYPETQGVGAPFVRISGTLNHYNVIVGGNSRGVVLSGYSERPKRAAVALGYPGDLFPGETNNTIPQVVVRDLICPVNYSNSAPFIEVNTTVQDLLLENVFGGDLIVLTNETHANALRPTFGAGVHCANSFVRWPTASVNLQSTPYTSIKVNGSYEIHTYSSGATNKVIDLDSTGARINAQVGINSSATAAPLTIQQSSLGESWMAIMGTTNGAGVSKTARVGVFPWDGSTTPQTMLFGNITGSGAATLSLGGGTTTGKPFSVLDLYAGATPSTGNAGTNLMRLNSGGVYVQSGASVFHSLSPSNRFDATVHLPALTASRALYLDAGNLAASASGTGFFMGDGTIGDFNDFAALVTGTPDGSKFLRDDGSWQAIPGGGDALTSNPLSQFAATTSAQLAGVLSDETGTGAAVFAGGNIGAATSTTPSADDNDTSVATTAYVQTELTAYDSDTRTFTGKTFDAAATGNELNFKGYLALRGFDNATGALPVNTNDFTVNTFMQPVFLNGTDKASNFIEWRTSVPDDLDTSTALRARVKFKLTAADTGSHRYVLSFASVAASGAYAGTPGTEINLDFAGDASGASGDFEQVGFTTLTDWAANVTPGDLWVIRLARDGDTSDTSTVNSAFCELTIEYGVSQ